MKIFGLDFRKGTLIDSVSKTKWTLIVGDGWFKKDTFWNSFLFKNTELSYITEKPSTNQFSWRCVAKRNTNNVQNYMAYAFWGNKLLSLNYNNWGINVYDSWINALSYITNNVWVYLDIVVLFDWVNSKLYIDWILVDSGTISSFVLDNNDLHIWYNWTHLWFPLDWSFVMAEVYDTILTSQQINNLHQELLHSYGTTEQKRNFIIPKPTDLSSEVDSVIGDSLVINGDMELNSNWLNNGLPSVNERSIEQVYSGTYSRKFTSNTNGWGIKSDSYNTVAGKKYKYSLWVYPVSSTDVRIAIRSGDDSSSIVDSTISGLTTDTWNHIGWFYTETTTGTFANIRILQAAGAEKTRYVDNVSVQEVTGLVAAYNMIPSSDWVLVDISGNWNNGTINGAISTKDGMKFDGVDDEVILSNPTLFNFWYWDFSFQGRAKINHRSQYQTIFTTRNAGYWVTIYVSPTNDLFLEMPSVWLHSSITIPDFKSFSFAVIRTGNTSKIFINWIDVSDTIPTNLDININSWWGSIGSCMSAEYLDWVIEDLRIYNKALTPIDIKNYHNSFNKLTLRNTLKDEGADGVVKTPRDFIKGTGSYKVEENTDWTKYLENTVAGTIATQSKLAYGTWEFDVYKGEDNNWINIPIISDRVGGYQGSIGYNFIMYVNETIQFETNLVGSSVNLFYTATNYINNNTLYKIKVARLQSKGIFKDIPRLNPDKDLETMTSPNDYTITDINSYGGSFSADGAKNCYGATANSGSSGFSFNAGDVMKVSFDLNLISGTAPEFLLMQTLGSGSSSAGYRSVDGHNELYITATTSRSNGVLGFRNSYEATEFIMSGLKIEKVYDTNTFAVFIKGWDFGDEYTLVDTTGGSGTNPVTDSTYTESEYLVADLDVGDKISNIKLQSQVQQ